MSGLDRVVAGVACREVLADLSDYLDGALSELRVSQLRAHLEGCENCMRFGNTVAATLQALRDGSQTPPVLPADSAARLRARLAEEYRKTPAE